MIARISSFYAVGLGIFLAFWRTNIYRTGTILRKKGQILITKKTIKSLVQLKISFLKVFVTVFKAGRLDKISALGYNILCIFF